MPPPPPQFVRIKATKEQADDLIASKRSLLLHPDKIESRLKVLASMLTYMAAGGDNRRKHLGFRKQSAVRQHSTERSCTQL